MYLAVFVTVFLLVILYLYIQNNLHKVTSYKVFIPNLHSSVKDKKILFISDTHFREKNSHAFIDQILNKIEKIEPDLILFGGDIIHVISADQVIEQTKDFFSQLEMIAPTYVVYGNHDLGSERLKELTATLKRVGVTLLNNEATWISFDKSEAGFWLMGLNEYMSSVSIKQDVLSKIKMTKESKNEPKILLAHYPHFFEKYLMDEDKRPNLVLSGHTHGGQVILPIIGGLFAPGQGKNPYYDFGLFTSDKHPDSRLIISRGLGNSTFPFRINNRPEIIMIEFE